MKIIALVVLLVGSCLAETTVEKLVKDNRFTTLVRLVTQANLVDTLNGGNFTIFAPTNAAFAKVPADILAHIQAASQASLLGRVLTYHVLSGKVMSKAVTNELVVKTVERGPARFNVYTHNGMTQVTIEGCVISTFDIEASNGVIHVIDSVMMIPLGDIVRQVYQSPKLTTVLALVKQAGLATALQGEALTLFAPTNDAFAKLDPVILNAVQTDAVLLKNVLMYHVVPSTQYSAGLYDMEKATTLLTGKNVTVHTTQGVMINDATVVEADLGTTNGVVHVIDRVLIPPPDKPAVVG